MIINLSKPEKDILDYVSKNNVNKYEIKNSVLVKKLINKGYINEKDLFLSITDLGKKIFCSLKEG